MCLHLQKIHRCKTFRCTTYIIVAFLFPFQFQEEKGNIKFKLEVGLKEFVGADGKLTGVKISTDEIIEADVAIVGIGVVPSTSFLKESSLDLTRRGEVVVDEVMGCP